MAPLPSSPQSLLPAMAQANMYLRYFDEAAVPRIAEFALRRMTRGASTYTLDATPADVEGVAASMVADPLSALRSVVERGWLLWNCEHDIKMLNAPKKMFAALKVRSCSFCPPARAGKTLTIFAEEIVVHPLLECALPACNGSAYLMTARKVAEDR